MSGKSELKQPLLGDVDAPSSEDTLTGTYQQPESLTTPLFSPETGIQSPTPLDEDENVDLSKFKDVDDDDDEQTRNPTPQTTDNTPSTVAVAEEEGKLAPVSCGTLFRYATKFDIFLNIIGLISSLTIGLLMPLSSLLMGDMLNNMQDPKKIENTLDEMCFWFFAMGIISLVCGLLQNFTFSLSSERQARSLRQTYLKSLFSHKIAFHDTEVKDSIASKLTDYTSTVQAGLDKLGLAISNFGAFVFAIALAFSRGPQLAGILLAPLPVFFLIIGFVMSRIAKATVAEQKAYSKANTLAQETFDGIREVNVFGMKSVLIGKYITHLEKAYSFGLSAVYAKSTAFMAFLFLMFSMYSYGIYIGGIHLIAKGKTHGGVPYTGGDVIAVFYILLSGMQQVGQSIPSLSAIAAARASMAPLLKIIDTVDEVPIDPFDFIADYNSDFYDFQLQNRRNGRKLDTSLPNSGFIFDASKHGKKLVTRLNFTGSINVKNVSFSYPSRPDVEVLTDFSFTFKSGLRYGIVGPSGSSKSTIFALLQRLYDPTKGDVFIEVYQNINPAAPLSPSNTPSVHHPTEWVNLKDIYIGPWRKFCCGLAVQESSFFTGSIGDNIKLGNPFATSLEVITAARLSHAHDFIMAKEGQYNYFLQQASDTLSGGESSRVGLARTLLMRPSLLLLDEYSAALDYNTEFIVTRNLGTLFLPNTVQNIAADQENEQNALLFTQSSQRSSHQQVPGSPHIRLQITVAHRLITIRNADVILAMENGSLKEYGSHDELLTNPEGVYSRLYNAHPDVSISGLNAVNSHDSTSSRTTFVMTESEKDNYSKIKIKPSNFVTSTDHHLEEKNKSVKIARAGRDYKLSRLTADIFRSHPILMLLACISIGFGGASFPFFSWIFGHALKALYEPVHDTLVKNVKLYALYFFLFAVVMSINTYLTQALLGIVGERLIRRFRTQLYTNLIQQEIGFFDRDTQSAAQLTTKLAKDTTQIRTYISQFLNTFLSLIAQTIISLYLSYTINAKFTLIMCAIFPVSAVSAYLHFSFIRGFAGQGKNLLESSGAVAIEASKNLRTLTAFNAESFTFGQFRQLQSTQLSTAMRSGILGGFGFGISQALFYIGQALSYYFGGKMVLDGDLRFDQFFQIYQTMRFASQQFSMLLAQVSTLDAVNAAVSDMYDLIDRETLQDKYLEPLINVTSEQRANPSSVITRGSIEFNNVSFHYPTNRDKQVLKNISFKTELNETDNSSYRLALVGKSGMGKSTLNSLLLGFYVSVQKGANERVIMTKKEEYFNKFVKPKFMQLFYRESGQLDKLDQATAELNSINGIASSDVIINIHDETFEIEQTKARNAEKQRRLEEMSPDEMFIFKQQRELDFETGGKLRNPFESGQVLIDGHDINTIPRNELYKRISVVFQKPHIFKDTVWENITCGDESITEAQVDLACKQAQIYDFINKLPKKFQTMIDKTKVSMGQAMRITIARAMARNPALLLLDEMNASLDNANSARIDAALNEAMRNRCAVVIAHRLESIIYANQILVIDNQQIIERGTYKELLDASKKNPKSVFASFLDSSSIQ